MVGLEPEDAEEHEKWMGRCTQAAWIIMHLYKLQSSDDPFVMNAINFGVERALETVATPAVIIFITPELPMPLCAEISVELVQKLSPLILDGPRPDVTNESGEPAGTWAWRPGGMVGDGEKPSRVTVVRGARALPQMVRNGERIYLDVTNATKGDIISSIPQVMKLKKKLKISPPAAKRGAATSRDENKALDAAMRRLNGESILDIAKHHGWQISFCDNPSGSSPTTVKYIQRGQQFWSLLTAFEEAMDTSQISSPQSGT